MSEKISYTDLSYLREASGGNAAFMKEMIQLFLKQTPDYLLQLKNDIEQSNWDDFRKILHKLKPTVTMMGIKQGEEIIKRTETRVKGLTELELVKPEMLQLEEICTRSFDELKELMSTF